MESMVVSMTDKWIMKMWCIYTILYIHIFNVYYIWDEILFKHKMKYCNIEQYGCNWMILSEISQTQEDKYWIFNLYIEAKMLISKK
jgi:hypothetical protein